MSAEQTFRINDEWFRELVDLAPVFIWIADPDGKCMYCNRARLEFTGRTMEQEMGDGWNECVHPDDLDNRMTVYKSAVAAQREFKVEYRLRRHDGEYRRVLAHGVPRVAETGELLRYVGSCIDVTDRKRAEAEIQARLRQQAAIVEIVQNLALARTLEDVTGIVRKGVRKMLGADGATFVVREGDEVHYIDEDAIGKLWKGQRFPIGECISGWAMLNRRPAVVEDIHNDPRIPIPAYESTFVKSLIMAPVRSTDPVASIGAYWATARTFSQDEVDCLQAVADSAAVALTNNDLITALEQARDVAESRAAENAELFATASREFAERRLAAEALRAAENRYRALFEHTPCSVWAADPANGSFLDFNEAAHRSLGYTRAEFSNLTIPDIESRETRDQVAARIQRIMETGYDEFETEHKTKSGEIRNVFVRVHRLELDDRAYLESIVLDITERRQAEEQARQHQAELAHFARVSTMGEMASGLAHELNQPLTAVVNYAQGALRRLRSGGGADEKVLNAIERATEQAHRAAKIIRRLASFVQKREPRRSSCNLNDAVREVVSFLEADAREQAVRIDLDLSVDLPGLLADNIQIQQVILNLVRNGIEAMSEMTVAERVLGIRTSVAGDAVEVAVCDRGPGLTPDMQERVFTPFYTTKSRGMGMGLSISRSIIDAHGGRLWAASNPDRGNTFHFTLPFSAGAPDDEHRSDRLRRG
jgi:PAS domain S-box-containing protein